MYHGEVQVAEEHLKDFMKTAETLQVKGLAEGSAIPVLADDEGEGSNPAEVTEEERLMLRTRRLMRRRTNNESNDDEPVDPTTTTPSESQKAPSSVSLDFGIHFVLD